MWEQVKQVIVEVQKKYVAQSELEGKNPKSVWWSNEIKAAVKRKEAAWKGVLAASNEETKEICMETYREEKRRERLKDV